MKNGTVCMLAAVAVVSGFLCLAAAAAAHPLPVAAAVLPAAAGENEDMRFARRLRDDGMHVAAAEEYVRFIEKYPQSPLVPAAFIEGGESYMQAGRAQDALDLFRAYLTRFPDLGDACRARVYCGRILKALKRYEEGAEEFALVGRDHPECPYLALSLLEGGDCLLAAGRSLEAAGSLARLVADFPDSEHAPRGRYILSLALSNMGRELEAEQALRTLVAEHPSSPVTAMALLRLGERAERRGDVKEALEHYGAIRGRFREEALIETAAWRTVVVLESTGDDAGVLGTAEEFVRKHPESERLAEVLSRSFKAAWRLGRHERGLALVGLAEARENAEDPDGEILLYRARFSSARGDGQDALASLERFRLSRPRSPLRLEALLLEAELLKGAGRGEDAYRVLNLALLESSGEERHGILRELADLSYRALGDTLTALRCWESLAEHGGGHAEEAIWLASRAREEIGDLEAAARGYSTLLERYGEGEYAERAAMGIGRISTAPAWDRRTALAIAGAASAGGDSSLRNLEIGVILVQSAHDPARALGFLDDARRGGLPEPLNAKAAFYAGMAHQLRWRRSTYVGKEDKGARKEAASAFLDAARSYPGTEWGERAHREYLEMKFDEWNLGKRLETLDDYLAYYGAGEGKWWALRRKLALLSAEATNTESWAADSALAVSGMLLAEGAPGESRPEALEARGRILRMRGDLDGAAASYGELVRVSPAESYGARVLFELGEIHLERKDFDRARESFGRCLGRRPPPSIADRCELRIGDCLYSQRRFKEAAAAYNALAGRMAGNPLGYDAAYRGALAREWLGERREVDSILVALEKSVGLTPATRARVLAKLGGRLLDRGEDARALEVLTELVSVQRSGVNLGLYARALSQTGDYDSSVRAFGEALRFEDADSCDVLAGRAKARMRQEKFKDGLRDLEELVRRCPGSPQIPAVILEKGAVEAATDRCDQAAATLGDLAERFPQSPQAADALYHLALCDIKRGAFEGAVEKLSEMLRRSPRSEILDKVCFRLATAHYRAGDLKLAAEQYGRAAEATSDRELAFLARQNMGRVYQELEEYERAAAAWQDLIERFPEHEGAVESFFNLGFSYSQAGRHEMAYEVYNRIPAIAVDSEQRARAHYWAGISLKSLGRNDEAVREFLRVPYLHTGGMWGVTAKLEAAGCYERIGRMDEAREIYENVLRNHGADSNWGKLAREALDRLAGAEGGRDGS